MAETLKLVSTLATTVPTFFMREKPTSSMANPGCMNMTSTAATITQTVSAPTAAGVFSAGSSSAKALNGMSARSVAATRLAARLVFMAVKVGGGEMEFRRAQHTNRAQCYSCAGYVLAGKSPPYDSVLLAYQKPRRSQWR